MPGVVVDTDLGPWTVHETPGHAPSHVCLHQAERRILISGDHLLGRVSLYFDYGWTPDPIGEFLDSLDKVQALDARLCLAGHARTFTDVVAHIEANRALVHERLARVREVVAERGPITAYEIVPLLYGEPITAAQRGLVAARDALLPAPPGGHRRARARRRRARALGRGRLTARQPAPALQAQARETLVDRVADEARLEARGDDGEAERAVEVRVVGVVDVDAGGLARGVRRRADALGGLEDLRVVGGGAREAERAGEVGGAEEEDVDAVDRRDLARRRRARARSRSGS